MISEIENLNGCIASIEYYDPQGEFYISFEVTIMRSGEVQCSGKAGKQLISLMKKDPDIYHAEIGRDRADSLISFISEKLRLIDSYEPIDITDLFSDTLVIRFEEKNPIYLEFIFIKPHDLAGEIRSFFKDLPSKLEWEGK